MHKISDKTVQTARTHVEQALKQGQFIEAFAKRLLENNQISEDDSQIIKAYGKEIQWYAREFQLSVEALNDTYSLVAYDKAVKLHVAAIQAYWMATSVYTRLINLQLQHRKEPLTLHDAAEGPAPEKG